jgi:hypothetical protein
MGKQDRSRAKKKNAEKKKRREKRLRLERNRRRNEPESRDDYRDEIDIESALEALPPEVGFERVMRRIALATGRRGFANEEEMESLLSGLDAAARARLAAVDESERAQDLYFLARDPAYGEHAMDMLEDALELDPQCPDAIALHALLDPDVRSPSGETPQIRALERAVSLAERTLREPLESALTSGNLWDDVLSRPYIRARRMLASTLHARMRFAESVSHSEAVLALELSDPLFTRGGLIGSLLALGETRRASEELELLSEDHVAFACFGRGLERWLAGDRARAAESVRLGRQVNPHVETHILSRWPLDPETYDPDESDAQFEASEIRVTLGLAWTQHPEAYEWLASGAPASTAQERAAARQSFAKPVSALFTLGEPEVFVEWRDYAGELGLSTADAPELLRLATHRALHELEDTTECWAPMHAWRALGRLGDAGAVLPLLDLSLDRADDDELTNDLPQIFVQIGEPAVRVLIQFLAENEQPATSRAVVIEALGELAAAHPSARSAILDVLGKELARHAENDMEVNNVIVSALIEARAVELTPLVREAFEAGTVDTDWNGTLEEIEEALASEPDPR